MRCNTRRTIFHLPSAKRTYVFSFQYARAETRRNFNTRILTTSDTSDTLKCDFLRRGPAEARPGNAEPFLSQNLPHLRNNITEKPETRLLLSQFHNCKIADLLTYKLQIYNAIREETHEKSCTNLDENNGVLGGQCPFSAGQGDTRLAAIFLHI